MDGDRGYSVQEDEDGCFGGERGEVQRGWETVVTMFMCLAFVSR